MKILAIEASGQVCGTAVLEDDILVADYNIKYKKTHSQSLVPMMDEVRQMVDLDLGTIDAIAVTKGPGSFTGVRIGAATAKGLGLALNKPIIPVPTVDAIAYNLYGTGSDQVICPIMDARRSQVYTGVYEFSAEESEDMAPEHPAEEKSSLTDTGTVRRAPERLKLLTLKEQCVISIEEICAILNCVGSSVIFLGDGIPVYRERIGELLRVPFCFAPAHLARQRAAAAAALAMQYYREQGEACMVNADDFRPEYLRLSQAERERAAGKDTSLTVHRD